MALSIKKNNMNFHSYIDSFFMLIHGLDYEMLSVLCDKIYLNFNLLYGNDSITREKCYELTQKLDLNYEIKKMIVDIACECINNGMYLGTKTSSNFNLSSWINHSYYVSSCCSDLSKMVGIDSEKAKTYGLLHDYGRKLDYKFDHVILGFQELYNLGFKDESVACLTHSFVNGGRCCNNERAVSGFYVDSLGNPQWKNDASYDDITLFLNNYQYNDYDIILNIADLMATDKGIVSPYDRIKDIATRRELDVTNRGYFLCEVTNVLIDLLKKANLLDTDINYIKASEGTSLEYIENYFKQVSNYFYVSYKQCLLENENDKKI